jgi:hypothetical protein
MNANKHPYAQFEHLPAWKVLKKAIDELTANNDITQQTDTSYIVGFLIKKLIGAKTINVSVNKLKDS